MCRIVGIIQCNISESVLSQMRDSLSYGGPDDAGLYINKKKTVGLGHRRLSIIDLSTAGHQPMSFKHWTIVFNGEIYNYKEIAEELIELGYTFDSGSDTEVILKSFDCWGTDAVKKFRGMFAFALWNEKTEKLLLCRDRVGVKPLYWHKKEHFFMFSSELKAFFLHPNFEKSINQKSVSLFLQTGYIRAPYSIFNNTFKVEPGSFLEVDVNSLEIKQWKYWNIYDIYENAEIIEGTESKIIAQCETILSEAFKLRMVADVPVGMFLSGGIDSSLVTAILQRQSKMPLNTFTIGFEDKVHNEAHYASEIAKHIGTNHTELYCTESDFTSLLPLLSEFYDEPFGDSSAIPTFLVSKLAKEKVTVSLSADAGDEIFGGYERYLFIDKYFSIVQRTPNLFKDIFTKLLDFLSIKQIRMITYWLGKISTTDLDTKLPRLIDAIVCKNEIEFFHVFTSYLTKRELSELISIKENIFSTNIKVETNKLYSAIGVLDITSYLEGDILTKVDRATMQVALEGREPFLDHKIIEFALSLPDSMKIRNGETKWILRQILYKYVPKQLIDRPKKGFSIPLDKWLSSTLRGELEKIPKDEHFICTMGLNQQGVKDIIEGYLNRKFKRPYIVWFLYVLYNWYNRWIRQ